MTTANSDRIACSLVVVAYNSSKDISRLLDSTESQVAENRLEFVIVDNASHDQSELESLLNARDYTFPIHFIRNDTNQGFAAAANRGATVAQGEFMLFVNPDIVWLSPAYDTLRRFLSERPEPVAATARLEYPDGSFQANCRAFPHVANLLFSRGSPLGRIDAVAKLCRGPLCYTLPDAEGPMRVPAASASALAIRRSTFWQLGGFDPGYFLYVEDTDLCRRLADAGGSVWFVPQARACHHWPGHAPTLDRRRHHRNGIRRYLQKFRPNRPIANAIVDSLLDAAMVFDKLKRPQ